jgi:hypothetical protein
MLRVLNHGLPIIGESPLFSGSLAGTAVAARKNLRLLVGDLFR